MISEIAITVIIPTDENNIRCFLIIGDKCKSVSSSENRNLKMRFLQN